MYGHAHLLLTRCEECGDGPQLIINDDGKKVCARCGLTATKMEMAG